MDVMATLALQARGRSAWNAWAAEMIERRRAIIAAGDWSWARDSRTDIYPTNKITGDWMQDADADFGYRSFDDADFSGFVFPGYASFVAATFHRTALFREARFCEGAGFTFTRFEGDAAFEDAEFRSRGNFFRAEFRAPARFDRCRFVPAESAPTFQGLASFNNAKFLKLASFVDMYYAYGIHLTETQFIDRADFDGVVADKTFSLHKTVFGSRASFRDAELPSVVSWSAASFAVAPEHGRRPMRPG